MKHLRSWLPLLAVASLGGCSSTDSGLRDRGSSANGSPGSNGQNGGSDGNGGGSAISFDASTQHVSFDDDACAAEVHAAESIPVDMYVMMDQSDSMNDMVTGGSKWAVVTSALKSFVQSPAAAGIGVGIQYFGLAPGSSGDGGVVCSNPYYCPATMGGFITGSCNASDYAIPDVEIAPLPGNSGPLVSSIQGHMPTSDTPTAPALQGAVDHATAWAQAHPAHPTVVLLATDGEPDACNSTTQGVAQVAATALAASPSIMTFVIGVGSMLTDLDTVAQSGGTTKAYVVDTGQDVTKQFTDALTAIRGRLVIPCEYQVPSPTDPKAMLDLNKVNVVYTPGTGATSGQAAPVFQVTDMTQCDGTTGGWFYNDPQNPTKIELCQATCAAVTNDGAGNVGVSVGCQTVRAPVH